MLGYYARHIHRRYDHRQLARRSKITEVAQMTTAEARVLAQVLDNVVKVSDGPSKVDARSLARKIVGQLNIPKDFVGSLAMD